MKKGIVVSFAATDDRDGRVQIGLSPTSPEAIAFMHERYGGPVDYEDGGYSALRRFEPPEIATETLTAVEDIADLGLMTCGRRPFPEAVLNDPPPPNAEGGPDYDALAEALEIYVDVYGDLSTLSWIKAEHDEFGATFLARDGERWLEAPVFAGIDGWAPGTIDDCEPRAYSTDDYQAAHWWLDPAYPQPTDTDTIIHALVMEIECSGSRSPAGSISPPLVSYGADSLRIDVGVRPVAGGATCPGNHSFPVTIVLPEPVGDRELAGDADPERI
jgi:hypothetical protein